MKKTILIMIIVSSFLFITSCSNGGNLQYYNPYTGTEGLSMSFVEGMPPYQVYENEDFNIALNIENRGAYDITNGILNIITENDIMKAKDYTKTFSLYGKNKYTPHGEKKMFMIPVSVGNLREFTEMNSIVIANACYEYKTFFSSPICIDPKFYDNTIDKPCYPEPITSSGTGAPIAITKVEPRFTQIENDYHEKVIIPMLIVHISKMTNEELINPYSIERICGNGRVEREDYGKIYIDKAKLGNVDMECTPNPVTLVPEEESWGAIIRCKYKGEIGTSEGTHTSIVNIVLRYGMSQKINKRIKILNAH